ncbi:MAG: hypothetical protein AAF485_15115 [Chloroflexota bacterium]
MEPFVEMLTGGHPNSLGRTIEVVDTVLADQSRLEELYQCYFDDDEVVRLRTSNALKRISKEHPEWLVPYLDRFLSKIAKIDQASTQWTLAELFSTLTKDMTPEQLAQGKELLRYNLTHHNDWIVLNRTMQTLSEWSDTDDELRVWLIPQLETLAEDSRKSVAKRAEKLYAALTK